MNPSENDIDNLTSDLEWTDHDWRKYREKAKELLLLLSNWKDIRHKEWMLRYYDDPDLCNVEAENFWKKMLKYYEGKKDYRSLYNFLNYFILRSDEAYFGLISQKTRAKLVYLENVDVIWYIERLRQSVEDSFPQWIEEDLMYAIADAGLHISNVWRYFLWNHHLELEKKIINSLPDEKVRNFIRWMLYMRIMDARIEDVFVDSWFIVRDEDEKLNDVEKIKIFKTVKNICGKEIQDCDRAYNYFRKNKLTSAFERKDFEKWCNERGIIEIKTNYIKMIDALYLIQKKLTDHVNSLPKDEDNNIKEEEKKDDLPF